MSYLVAGSKQNGALGVFHLYAPETRLAADIDARLGGKNGPSTGNHLINNELRYGWFWDERGRLVDEVMLGRPAEGMRVLTSHGGLSVRESVTAYLEEKGYREIDIDTLANNPESINDSVLDSLLSSCLTEAQAAAVLSARLGGEPPPAGLMRTHRVLLAGAPNAGKSSLLNHLCGYERAFVDEGPGATRDVVDELADVGGFPVWLGDLPGFGAVVRDDALAGEAWRRAEKRLAGAEWVWLVVDGSRPWEGESRRAAERVAELLSGRPAKILAVVNKSDLPAGFTGEPWRRQFPEAEAARVSSLPEGDAGRVLGEMAERLFGEFDGAMTARQ